MITASSLSRLLNCPGSSVLPRAETASVWADAGHEEHAELADQLLRGDLPDWIARHIPAGSRPELALAFDVATRTGRVVGENIGRAYGDVGPFEIVGSADAIGIDGDAVVVVDFKTGHNDVEPAATNPQLAFYCLAAARALGKTKAIARIIYTKSNRVDEASLDALDLAAFAGRLERLHVRSASDLAARNRGEPVSTREGSWCKWCSSAPYCGSKVALIAQMAGLTVIGDGVTSETAAVAYEQVVRIESLIRDARQRLSTFVDEQGPIDLGNGRMFGRYVRKGNESLDGDVAVTAIAEVIGESAREFESIAIERKVTKAAIERAAKQLGCKRGTVPAVVKRIRDLGGASHGADSMPLGEYVADRNEPAPRIDNEEIDRLLESA